MTVNVLILYYSRHGSILALAQQLAKGVLAAGGTPVLRTVAELNAAGESPREHTPSSPVVTAKDLEQCDALALGSPSYFGNMAAPIKYFFDNTSKQWLKGSLIDKPASVFSSSSTQHGGNEATLLTMILPLLHHGMILVGTPYSVPELSATTGGGSPYGASHVSGLDGRTKLDEHERIIAYQQGRRLTEVAQKLHSKN